MIQARSDAVEGPRLEALLRTGRERLRDMRGLPEPPTHNARDQILACAQIARELWVRSDPHGPADVRAAHALAVELMVAATQAMGEWARGLRMHQVRHMLDEA
ncbi:MAG TPA: hypothetical protein VIM76_09385 [Candidatus Dormibacteraeota bacterium]|jgi:hypothetical protein